MDATFLSELAWHITCAGGTGVEDLGLPPESHSGAKHIKLLLGHEFTDPDLYYVKAPLHDKITSQRIETSIPIHLPSAVFEEHLESHVGASGTQDDAPDVEHLNCQKWLDHPVRKRHRDSLPDSRIRPVALYWDGVQYSLRDNFFALYIRDLITGVSHLMVLVSLQLS